MKLSFVVPVPEKGQKLNEFYQKIRFLKELGYDGVELAVRDPKKIDEKKVRSLIEELKLEVPAIGTGSGYIKDGLSLCHLDKAIRRKALARVKSHIEFASQFGAKVIIGLIRGNLERNVSEKKAYKYIVDALKECAEFAAKYNVELVLEPIIRYEMDLIHTLKEAKEMIQETACSNIGILADTFHMNVEENQICHNIKEVGDFINHVHLADSNRMAPGQGHLDFKEILRSIIDTGYNGFLTVELVPVRPDFETAARQSIVYLTKRK